MAARLLTEYGSAPAEVIDYIMHPHMSHDRSSIRPLARLRGTGVRPFEALELFDYIEEVPLWMKDRKGHYRWVNLPFLLNYGVEGRDEVIGRTDYDLSSPALANQYRLDDDAVLKGARILARVELVGRFDHTARWCVTSKIPLRDANGKVVGTAGITRPLKGRPRATDDAPLSRAILYLTEHYAEPITNRQLARLCGMSVRSLERHFVETYRVTPHAYLRQLRVRMSCSGLVFSPKPLAVLAGEVGFADQSHFAKAFRRFFGETPSAYRARYTPSK
jgi:AraC-like DNA-binding protein